MNYDKLSRSIRQYYKKGIIRKPDVSRRLVYQFVNPVWWRGFADPKTTSWRGRYAGHTVRSGINSEVLLVHYTKCLISIVKTAYWTKHSCLSSLYFVVNNDFILFVFFTFLRYIFWVWYMKTFERINAYFLLGTCMRGLISLTSIIIQQQAAGLRSSTLRLGTASPTLSKGLQIITRYVPTKPR